MIKFFRKFRQKILSGNKFSKYLLYAVGEIILVVIGILIALYINNENEERIKEEQVANTLKQIQVELLNDIFETKTYSKLYSKKIVMIDEFINQKRPLAYFDENISDFISLTFGNQHLTISDQSFLRLKEQIDILPRKYNWILPYLNRLYVENGSTFKRYSEVSNDVLIEFKNKIFDQYNWVEDYTEYRYTSEVRDFFLTSETNRRQLVKMRQVLKTDLEVVNVILDQSIYCYFAIKKALNDTSELPQVIKEFGLDYELNSISDLTGTYTWNDKLKFKIEYQNNLLLLIPPVIENVRIEAFILTELAKDSLGQIISTEKFRFTRDALGNVIGCDYYPNEYDKPVFVTKQ